MNIALPGPSWCFQGVPFFCHVTTDTAPLYLPLAGADISAAPVAVRPSSHGGQVDGQVVAGVAVGYALISARGRAGAFQAGRKGFG